MTKNKIEIFIIISVVLHLFLIYCFNFLTLNINTKKLSKNKEKSPIKVKFIDLPDKLPEIKHKEKTPYIAQKSFKAKKNTKKENPLMKNKSVVIKDVIPNYINSKPKISSKKSKPKKTQPKKVNKTEPKKSKKIEKKVYKVKQKQAKIVKKNPIKEIKKKKNELISLNKINPNYEELLKKGLIKNSNNLKRKKTQKNNSKKSSKNFKSNPELIAPGFFKPSHIYPDDIDISDSISISTQASRYASYLHKVKRKIELVWEYPPLAGEMGIQGRLFIKFEIDKNGHLKMIKLLKSSGAKILDEEAIRAIKEAAPYPPFPPDFKVNSIKIHACFDYIIVGKEIW